MKNVIYKNKVLGICFAVFAVFGTGNIALAEGYTYTRTPSGSGTYSSIEISVTDFDYSSVFADNITNGLPDSLNWDTCAILITPPNSANPIFGDEFSTSTTVLTSTF